MVSPAFLRVLSRVVMTGSLVLGRAVIAAYAQAAKEGAKRGKKAGGIMSALSGRTPVAMEKENAFQILGVKPDATPEQIEKVYTKLFRVNEPKTGGSFYLQSKVYRARECLVREGVIPETPPSPQS